MSKKLNDALTYAAECHEGQYRKLDKLPYIMHSLEVAAVIGTVTTDENVIIAGLLHDVVEDTSGTIEEITEKFGDDVAALVLSETENKRSDRPASETWKIRKEESLAELRNSTDPRVKILWLGDKVSNIRGLYRSYRKIGDEAFNMFHTKEKSNHAWYYNTIKELLSDLSDTAAYEEYATLVDKIFNEE